MNYYLSKIIKDIPFDKAEEIVREKLKDQGFGVITEIDIASTLKQKINEDFRPYKILGACNPRFAFKALSEEDKMGVMLPCNVCIQKKGNNEVEVITINPLETMKGNNSDEMNSLANEVHKRLKAMLDAI
ncbi:MAG: DUF302 domain-containing protein [Prolixibacteraceae bacterium]|nr:DUF302 domain-containing protein [Prolixibacteraceae bacterium]